MKKDIKNINFELFVISNDFEKTAKSLPLLQPWVLQQISAHIAQYWRPQKVNEYFSALETLKCLESDWDRGLYLALQKLKRSTWLTKQNSGDGTYYCALVPLILASYKKYHNIPYQQWNREELHWIVDPQLCEAMLSTPPQLSVEELLEIRQLGLRYQSGKLCGQPRRAQSSWRLYGIQHTKLGEIPTLAQTMLTQIWCAHPHLRNEYMVLDPHNWDQMPKPLITEDIFTTTTAEPDNSTHHDHGDLGSDFPKELEWMLK